MNDTLDGYSLIAIVKLIVDFIIFVAKSLVYISESIVLSLIPYKFRKLKDVKSKVVLITGGSGGVGRNLALNFCRLGSRVIIWDINREGIKRTLEYLNDEGYFCKGYVVDIADKEQVYETAKIVRTEIGPVDILINNAGIVRCKPLWQLEDNSIEKTYSVNILSHYWTVKAFLTDMMAKNDGHIVTVGSVAGMIGTYGCTDYSATKFACAGFHESLFTELRTHGYDNIHLTLVCPYYIATGMFSGVKPRLMPMLTPEFVADSITRSVRKNEVNCVLPPSVKFMLPLKCLLPAKMCWELMSRVLRGPVSMMMFEHNKQVAAA